MFERATIERVEREDLVLFINACFACTRQNEFYGGAHGQALSIEFLHAYTLGNYRRLYARTLAAGINHFNQAQIVFHLLAAAGPAPAEDRREEAQLIRAALSKLPPQRVLRMFELLRERRVNNRRAKAAVRDWIAGRKDLAYDAVKYRAKLRSAIRHAHLGLEGEAPRFLFELKRQKAFATPIFESFRRAHYEAASLYALPYTVAEGFAAKHRVPRDVFLAGIERQMSAGEKLRLQTAGAREDAAPDFDLARAPLTKLALYVLSLPLAEREARAAELEHALEASARRALSRAPVRLGKVAAVLDSSYSMSGSSEKRRRPLGMTLAASYLLQAASREYLALWTQAPARPILVRPSGQTRLADRLIDALEWGAELVLIFSDGFENDPPGGTQAVAEVYGARFAQRAELIHLNPVFDATSFAPRALAASIPTVGVRDAEDVPTMIGFARFAGGHAPLSELLAYLAHKMRELLEGA